MTTLRRTIPVASVLTLGIVGCGGDDLPVVDADAAQLADAGNGTIDAQDRADEPIGRDIGPSGDATAGDDAGGNADDGEGDAAGGGDVGAEDAGPGDAGAEDAGRDDNSGTDVLDAGDGGGVREPPTRDDWPSSDPVTAYCQRDVACAAAYAYEYGYEDPYAGTVDECVRDRNAELDEYGATYGADCRDAYVDYLRCVADADGCDDDYDRCYSEYERVALACAPELGAEAEAVLRRQCALEAGCDPGESIDVCVAEAARDVATALEDPDCLVAAEALVSCLETNGSCVDGEYGAYFEATGCDDAYDRLYADCPYEYDYDYDDDGY